MKKGILASVCAALCVATTFGANLYLKSASTDAEWTSVGNYFTDSGFTKAASALPAAGDTLFLASNTTYKITYSSTASSGWNTAFNILGRISMFTGARLEITVGSGTANMAPYVDCFDKNEIVPYIATVVKKGSGALKMVPTNPAVNWNAGLGGYQPLAANVEVQSGNFYLPTVAYENVGMGRLTLSGGTFHIATRTNGVGRTWCLAINVPSGCTITSDATVTGGATFGTRAFVGTVSGHSAAWEASTIAGSVSGTSSLYTEGDVMISGVSNANTGDYPTLANGATLMVTKIGGNASTGTAPVSSLGKVTGARIGAGTKGLGATFKYAGTGEQTYDDIQFLAQKPQGSNTAEPTVFDAGATGGITFSASTTSGSFGPEVSELNDSFYSCPRIVITGSNIVECTIASPFTRLLKGDVDYPTYLNKKGTGTWRLADNDSRYHTGVTQISQGTLRFDSIAAAGEMCSLGLSNALRPDNSRAVDLGLKCDYAFVLGDNEGDEDPIFEYTGSAIAAVEDRILALTGAGGHLRCSAGPLTFSGITSRDDTGSEATITLDGSTSGCVANEISDGDEGGKVSVVKDGTGSWTIGGNLTFSGDLKVKSGTLNVKANKPDTKTTPEYKDYKWYRLSIAEIADGSGGTTAQLEVRQIALYDKDGVRVNAGLVIPAAAYNDDFVVSYKPQEGEAAFDETMAGRIVAKVGSEGGAESLSQAFDGIVDGEVGGRFYIINSTSGSAPLKPNKDDEATWIRIVMHLPDYANPVEHFDIEGAESTFKYMPQRMQLEGSVNGEDWTVVYSNATKGEALKPSIGGYNYWMYDGVAATTSTATGKTTGYKCTKTGETVYPAEDIEYYRYYRLSIAEIADNVSAKTTASELQIRQISLFDKNGLRQNLGLTIPDNSYNGYQLKACIPAAGEAAFDETMAGHQIYGTMGPLALNQAFDGYTTGSSGGQFFMTYRDASGNVIKPTLNDRTTWIRIVMHLAEDANPVTHFDIEGYNNSFHLVPSRMLLEGSVDGAVWKTVWTNIEDTKGLSTTIADYNCWISNGDTASSTRAADKGFQCESTGIQGQTYDQFKYVSSIQVLREGTLVASHPTLEVKGYTMDATGDIGTVEGFNFAEEGIFSVVNYDENSTTSQVFQCNFVNCTNLSNIATWVKSVNGSTNSEFSVSITDGKVTVGRSAGFTILYY